MDFPDNERIRTGLSHRSTNNRASTTFVLFNGESTTIQIRNIAISAKAAQFYLELRPLSRKYRVNTIFPIQTYVIKNITLILKRRRSLDFVRVIF